MFSANNISPKMRLTFSEIALPLKLAIRAHLDCDWQLQSVTYQKSAEATGTNLPTGLTLSFKHRLHGMVFAPVFKVNDYKTQQDLINAINFIIAIANLFSAYPELGVKTYSPHEGLRIQNPLYTSNIRPIKDISRFFDTATWTLDTKKFQAAVNEHFKKALQEVVMEEKRRHPYSFAYESMKAPIVDFSKLPAKIESPLVLTRELIAAYNVDDVLTAPHHPGFEKAVYISGKDPVLGAWKKARRCTYDTETGKWCFQVPLSVDEPEYKFLIGRFDQGRVVATSELTWEARDNNREISWLEKRPEPEVQSRISM